jgi:hypothetical protein
VLRPRDEADDVIGLRQDIEILRALLAASDERRIVNDLHRQACIDLLNESVQRLEELVSDVPT